MLVARIAIVLMGAMALTASAETIVLKADNVPVLELLDEIERQAHIRIRMPGRAKADVADMRATVDTTTTWPGQAVQAVCDGLPLVVSDDGLGNLQVRWQPRPAVGTVVPIGDYRLRVEVTRLFEEVTTWAAPTASAYSGALQRYMVIEFRLSAPTASQALQAVRLEGLSVLDSDGNDVLRGQGKRADEGVYEWRQRPVASATQPPLVFLRAYAYSTLYLTCIIPAPPEGTTSLSIEGRLIVSPGARYVDAEWPWGSTDEVQPEPGLTVMPVGLRAGPHRSSRTPSFYVNDGLSGPAIDGVRDRTMWYRVSNDATRGMLWWAASARSFPRDGEPLREDIDANPDIANATSGVTLYVQGAPPAVLGIRIPVRPEGLKQVPFAIRDLALPPDIWTVAPAGQAPPATRVAGAPRQTKALSGGKGTIEVSLAELPVTIPMPLAVSVSASREGDDERPAYAVSMRGEIAPGRGLRLTNMPAGAYTCRAVPQPTEDVARLCEGYAWVGYLGNGILEPGGILRIDLLRLVPAVETVLFGDGLVDPADLEFRWQSYPGADYYRVALGFDDDPVNLAASSPDEAGSSDSDFWVSDKTVGTELQYDPKTGHIRSEDDERYLTLKPRIDYVFTVIALDSEGKVVSRGRSKPFRVK